MFGIGNFDREKWESLELKFFVWRINDKTRKFPLRILLLDIIFLIQNFLLNLKLINFSNISIPLFLFVMSAPSHFQELFLLRLFVFFYR